MHIGGICREFSSLSHGARLSPAVFAMLALAALGAVIISLWTWHWQMAMTAILLATGMVVGAKRLWRFPQLFWEEGLFISC